MNVLLTVETRFDRTPDGSVWTCDLSDYDFLTKYRDVFDEVRVLARIRSVLAPSPGARRADGRDVTFQGIPHYVGPLEFAFRYPRVRAIVHDALRPEQAILLRVPSAIASLLAPRLQRARRPHGLIIVGDPYDVFSPGAVRASLRPLFRWWFAHSLRRQCRGATACRYVTEHTLQRRYPPGPQAFAIHGSDIDLPPEAFAEGPRAFASPLRSPGIATLGSLSQMYKGTDVLIDAVSTMRTRGVDAHLTIVGDGKHRPELELRAKRLGMERCVRFLGQLPPGEPIRKELDAADLFVLPSRTEGLPRAMIEAMARALPCVGSTAGGIPELLHGDDMVAPGDAPGLAERMREVLASAARLSAMSARNLAKAREFRADVLQTRRRAFHEYLRDRTAEWLKAVRS